MPSLATLGLETNHIDKDGAIAIAGALKDVPSLGYLNLGGNDIRGAGERALDAEKEMGFK